MSEEITWKNPVTSGYIVLHHTVMERFKSFRQVTSCAKEAGGLLLGYRRGDHLEIVDATAPYPHDVRRRTFFDRCDAGHERYALRQWANSGRTIDYLGEWHTHPEAYPGPSHFDIKEWRVLLRRRQKQPLAFLIVGTGGIWMGCGNATGIKVCDM